MEIIFGDALSICGNKWIGAIGFGRRPMHGMRRKKGAANSWYRIWKKLPSGKYVSMGEYYCDMCLFMPGIGIYGKPAIWCIESTGNMEWVEWKDGRYSGKGLIP